MKKRVLAVAVLTILVLSLFAAQTIASVHEYTATGFRYIGYVFHEKEINVPDGSISFLVRGKGEVSGNHLVSASQAVYGGQNNVYLSAYFFGTTALDAAPNELMRITSSVELREATLQTGVEMDPGESGYIRQTAASSTGPEGSYLKTSNYFGNTGGTTRRVNEVTGFMTDRMEVVGYAQVWEVTTRRSGTAKTGFWDIN